MNLSYPRKRCVPASLLLKNAEPTSLAQVLPPQWINTDLRELDVSVLGKYDVVVADPPWAIHQEVRFDGALDPAAFR